MKSRRNKNENTTTWKIDGLRTGIWVHEYKRQLRPRRRQNSRHLRSFVQPMKTASRFLTQPKSTVRIQRKSLSEKRSRLSARKSLSQANLVSTTRMVAYLIVNQSTSGKWLGNH